MRALILVVAVAVVGMFGPLHPVQAQEAGLYVRNLSANVEVDWPAGSTFCGEVAYVFDVPESGMNVRMEMYWASSTAYGRPVVSVLSDGDWVPVAVGLSQPRFYSIESDMPGGYRALIVIEFYSTTKVAELPLRLQIESDVEMVGFEKSSRSVACWL